jgi:AsmA protein
MKAIRYLLYAVGALVVLALAAGAIFALTFDPNRYKGDIERLVKERTGRTLSLQGELELAFWPSLGAKVAGVTLSERGDKGEFLALESAHASVALMPLLRGEVVVDGVRVSGLKAQLVKGKDGRFNFQDLLEMGGPKPAAGASESEPAASRAVAFDISGIHVERSAVSYRDLASGQEFALSELELSTGHIAERAQGRLRFSTRATGGDPALDARVALGGEYRVDLPAKSLALSGFSLDAKGSVDKDPFEATIKAPQIAASAKALEVPKFSADLAFSSPKLPQKDLKLPVSGSLRADLEKQTASAELTGRFDESNIQAKLGLAKFAPPSYTFDVNVDRLDVDKYFPPEKKVPAPGKPAAAKPETPVDLSALKGLDASGRLQLGSLQVQGMKLANVKAEVRAANGRMEVAPHSADLYEGSVSGALTLQAQGNRVALKEKLAGISIGPLLRDAAQLDRLEGRGNVALDIAAAGASVEAMKKALSGTARIELRDGAIKGINIAEALRKARTALGSEPAQATGASEKTDFSELSASFSIKNGVAHNEDLDVKAPLFRLTGRGDIDIGNSRIDYVTRAAVVASAKGQGGAERSELAGLTLPVRVSGPFDDLSYKVDYGAAVAEAAKSKAGARLKEEVESRREKIEERLGDKLKGLLGR